MSGKWVKLASRRHIAALFLVLFAPFAHAAIYVHIDGIDGDVTAAGHEKWIEAVSVGYGVSRAISWATGRLEASRPNFSEVSILKGLDISSPALLTEAAVGKPRIWTIDFVTDTASPQLYYQLVLEEALISSVSHAFQSDGTPVENVSVVFAKITWMFVPFDAAGKPGSPIRGGYDVLLGTKI